MIIRRVMSRLIVLYYQVDLTQQLNLVDPLRQYRGRRPDHVHSKFERKRSPEFRHSMLAMP